MYNKETDKIYISNMCQGGWINARLQNCQYKHPFIFSAFEENDFIKFIENFEQMDLNVYNKIDFTKSKFIKFRNILPWDTVNEARGMKTIDSTIIEYTNGIQIIWPHVLKTDFDLLYEKRLNRFLENKNKEICFIFRIKNYIDKELVQKFYDLKKYKKILLFDEDVPFNKHFQENENTQIIISSLEHQELIDYIKKLNLLAA